MEKWKDWMDAFPFLLVSPLIGLSSARWPTNQKRRWLHIRNLNQAVYFAHISARSTDKSVQMQTSALKITHLAKITFAVIDVCSI